MGFLPTKAANWKGNQTKEKKCGTVNKAEKVDNLRSSLTIDIEVQNLVFLVMLLLNVSSPW